ncbi:MAG: glycosyltransferase involved in cell wall biosynthesis [Alphaproteobacteria bacterium]|jgi:glycosyltransferase involved in cell wall biosynthesis
MHIWVICQYFKPEPGAPSARLSGLAKAWVHQKQKVSILTSVPNHPKGEFMKGYENSARSFVEGMEGFTVARHKFYITKNDGFIKKSLSHISFAWRVLRRHYTASPLEKPDVIMISSPSFFAAISAWLLARKYNVPFVFEVRDLWPGIFKELGTIRNEFLLKIIEKLELFLYKKAAAVVTVTKGFAKDIAARGIDANKLYVVTNGVDDNELKYAALSKEDGTVNRLQSELQLTSTTKVLLYIGTHGSSQALGQIIDAARMMMHHSEVLFLFVGEGADKKRLEQLAKGMPNVQFLPSQEKERVWAFYNLAYVCFIPLKDTPGFKTFIPSKMFEVMASATPTIAMLDGEAAEILTASRSAIVTPPEKPDLLVGELQKLVENPARAEMMGKNGREFVTTHYCHSLLGKKYLSILNKVVQNYKDK